MRSRRPLWPHVAFAVFCACALSALIWPIYPALGNKIEPRVLGLPFSLAWIVAWIVASFLALVAYEWGVRRPAERDSASSTGVENSSAGPEA
jgi:predicted PurR-regulated permease PerM